MRGTIAKLMSDIAREEFPETEVWFEVNPTTMM